MSRKFSLRRLFGNRGFLDYSPEKFWGDRVGGRENYFLGWHEDFVGIAVANGVNTVLEVGAGYGDNLVRLKNRFQDYLGVDIVPLPALNILKRDIRIEVPNGFGCILSAGVLMHIPPKSIKQTIVNIKNATNFVFLLEQVKKGEFGERHPNNFVFYYDYLELFHDWKMVFCKEYGNKHFGFAFKKVVGNG